MKTLDIKSRRFIFYWLTSFLSGIILYYLLYWIIPYNKVFGTFPWTGHYQEEYPLLYIGLICFFYAIYAALLSNKFAKSKLMKQIAWMLLINIFCAIGGYFLLKMGTKYLH